MAQTSCTEPAGPLWQGVFHLSACWLATTRCNTLQHAATRCHTLQHTATHTSCDKRYFERTATHCNPSSCAVLQKQIDNIESKNQSTMRGKRGKAPHEMCEEPFLACGTLVGWLRCIASLCIVMSLRWMVLLWRGSFVEVRYIVMQLVLFVAAYFSVFPAGPLWGWLSLVVSLHWWVSLWENPVFVVLFGGWLCIAVCCSALQCIEVWWRVL